MCLQHSKILSSPSLTFSSALAMMLSSLSRVSARSVSDLVRLVSSFSTSWNSAGAPALPEVKAHPIFHASCESIITSPIEGLKDMLNWVSRFPRRKCESLRVSVDWSWGSGMPGPLLSGPSGSPGWCESQRRKTRVKRQQSKEGVGAKGQSSFKRG